MTISDQPRRLNHWERRLGCGPRLGDAVIARPGIGDADFLIGQGGQVVGIVEGGDRLPDRLERRDQGGIIRFGGLRGVDAKPTEHHIADVGRAIEQRNAAIGQLGGVFGQDQRVKAAEVGVRQAFPDHIDVMGDADRAPHIGHGILVAGVIALQHLQEVGFVVFPTRQTRLVQLLDYPGLDELRPGDAGGDDGIIAGRTRQHPGLHLRGTGIKVIDHADAGFGLKIRYGGLADIVSPVVQVDRRGLRPNRADMRATRVWRVAGVAATSPATANA